MGSLRAASAAEIVDHGRESAPVSYPLDPKVGWHDDREFDTAEVDFAPQHTHVWSDVSLDHDLMSGVCVWQVLVLLPLSLPQHFDLCGCGHEWLDDFADLGVDSSRVFVPLPGVAQSVQWTEIWCVLLAAASSLEFIGVHSVNVTRADSCLIAGARIVRLCESTLDGDLLIFFRWCLRSVEWLLSRLSRSGFVRLSNLLMIKGGAAADLERSRQVDGTTDARKLLVRAHGHWYPLVSHVHRVFVAISRAVVNSDGQAGIASDPVVWSQCGRANVRRVRALARDLARLLGPRSLWAGRRQGWPPLNVTEVDAALWLDSVDGLLKLVWFLSKLHWPS